MPKCNLKFVLLILLFIATPNYAFEFEDSILKIMNIPCIMVSTTDAEDPKEQWVYAPEGYSGRTVNSEYVSGKMALFLNDSVYYDSGEFLAGVSGMRIKIRGNTSALWSKKSYKIKLSKKADLFFRGESKYKAKDWILLNCPTLNLNTLVGFKISELLGMEWVPECQFVNLVINDDYKGLYVLTEAVEKDKGRLNISDNGFIIEDDAYWWSEDVYFKGKMLPDYQGYTLKYPDADDVTENSLSDIKDYILYVEEKLLSYEDIRGFLDLQSFAKWLLGHDILGTEDGRGSNRFFYKNSLSDESLLKIGPLWDFDDIFKRKDEWAQQHTGNYKFYYKYLLEYDEFINEYVNLWYDLKETLYNDLDLFLDEMQTVYGEDLEYSRKLDNKRYKRSTFRTLQEEVALVSTWMRERIAWIDEHIQQEMLVEEIYDSHDSELDLNKEIYLLDGRKLNSEHTLPAGIYIINGEKKIVKQY